MLARVPHPAALHDPAGEEGELRSYLGDGFDLTALRQSGERVQQEFEAAPDEATFYRVSEAYIYDLTVFAMSGTKLPYLETLVKRVPPGARVLDYGCGIGSDGLLLLELGYDVEFADFANPSTEYLRWRLARRGLDARVHDLDRDVPGGFDAVFSFDVIEHVPDPMAFMVALEARAGLVAVNLLEPVPNDLDLHYELPIAELRDRVVREGRMLSYHVFHGRSHLLIYEPGRAGLMGRLASRAHIVAADLGRRAARVRASRRGCGSSRVPR
jgi:SAM-dependent methyltransferase